MKNNIYLVLLLCFISFQSYASSVKLKMPNGIVANASYIKGDTDKPVVFLLHGFLQTHNFSTISRLSDSLSGEGYSVFSPTLTLGIPNRKKSLACEALHDHTMENDQDELDAWIKWLKIKGHKNIILLGHSQGSTSILSYVTKIKSQEVSKFIAVSILEVNTSRIKKENMKFNQALKNKLATKSRTPFINKLSFCVKYMGTPRSFMSYQNWSAQKIIKKLRDVKLPTKIVMGGSDSRIAKNWINELKKTGKDVAVINGASHFMDGVNEFDLLEIVLAEIEK